MRRTLRSAWKLLVVLSVAVGASSFVQAAPPAAETLLPPTTRLFVAVRNAKSLDDALAKTKMGGISKDETLRPFIDDLKKQLDERIMARNQALGLSVSDFRGLSDGEVCFAVVDLGEGKTGTAVLVDVTNHEKELAAVRGKIANALAQNKAQAARYAAQGGAQGTRYDIPPQKAGGPPFLMIETAQATPAGVLWTITDNAALTEVVSASLASGTAPQQLAQLPSFQKILSRTKPDAGEPAPHLAVFVDPLGLVAALRAYEHPPQKVKPDPLEVFRNAGFDAVQAIGGQGTVGIGDYGLLLRAAVIAPKPHVKSMQMLTFLTGPDFVPQPWVAADVTGYATLYWDTLKAFDSFDSLFDGFLEDEGIWAEVKKSIKVDEDGPKIDLRADLFALLGQRVTFVVDKKQPLNEDSSELLIAVETKRGANEVETKAIEEKLAVAIRKMFENDPSVKKMEIDGPQGKLNAWRVEVTEEVPAQAANQQGVVNGMRVVASAIVTVYGGHVYIASDVEILQKVLAPPKGPGLANALDYVAVADKIGTFIQKMGANPKVQALGFMRGDELMRIDYELLRAGKLSASKTIIGRLADLVLRTAEKEGRTVKGINGGKLPPFESVRKYFSPMGLVISETDDGLFAVGFTQEKNVPPAAVAAPAAK